MKKVCYNMECSKRFPISQWSKAAFDWITTNFDLQCAHSFHLGPTQARLVADRRVHQQRGTRVEWFLMPFGHFFLLNYMGWFTLSWFESLIVSLCNDFQPLPSRMSNSPVVEKKPFRAVLGTLPPDDTGRVSTNSRRSDVEHRRNKRPTSGTLKAFPKVCSSLK